VTNSDELVLDFRGGDFELAVSAARQETSEPSSTSDATGIGLGDSLRGFINTVLGLDLVGVQVNLVNPAARIIGLEDVGTVDTGLFEEDLTLFGQIGAGVALAFGQCEQVEGCAPSVTETEAQMTIAALDERIAAIDARLEQDDVPAAERAELESLAVEYRSERARWQAYLEDLREFLAGPTSRDGLPDDFEEELPEPVDTATLDALIGVVEKMYTRVSFFESLLVNPEQRRTLGARTGVDTSPAALQRIIDRTLEAVELVEGQIERLVAGEDVGTVEAVHRRVEEALQLDLPLPAPGPQESTPGQSTPEDGQPGDGESVRPEVFEHLRTRGPEAA
jgi:hypothetical protein